MMAICRREGLTEWKQTETWPLLCSAAEIISLPGWYTLRRDRTGWVLAECDTSCVTPAGSCPAAPLIPTSVHNPINSRLSKLGAVVKFNWGCSTIWHHTFKLIAALHADCCTTHLVHIEGRADRRWHHPRGSGAAPPMLDKKINKPGIGDSLPVPDAGTEDWCGTSDGKDCGATPTAVFTVLVI